MASEMKLVSRFQPLECLLVTALAAIIMCKGIWAGWHTLNTDFPQYYLVARLVAQHCCLDRIYDWIWLQRAADHAGISHQLVGFAGLTPFSALPILPLAWLPAIEAKRIWVALNIGLLFIAVQLVRKATGLPLLRTWLITLLAAIPLRTTFALGQMHLVVCVLLIAGWWFHLRGKQGASGCCIAIAGALKIYPLFYCFYFVFKRRWRALGAAVVISAMCLMLCYAIFGQPAMQIYLREQLPRTLQGEGNNPFLASATSASAMFHRLLLVEPELNPRPLISSLDLYTTLYPLWQALLAALILIGLRRTVQGEDRETLEWCAFLALLLFLSSAPATYHFVTLIAAAVPTYAILRRTLKLLGVAFIVAYTIACNASNVIVRNPFSSPHVYILVPKLWAGVCLIFIYAWLLVWRRDDLAVREESVQGLPLGDATSHPTRFLSYPYAAVVIATLWLGGCISSWRHDHTIKVDNSRKLQVRDRAWLRTSPQDTSAGLYYLAMLDSGYQVMRDGIPLTASASGDELSFAVDRRGREVWIETAGPTGSIITKAVQGDLTLDVCSISNAESPAVTADGSALAFIRESNGRGSLWITSPGICASSAASARETRVTPQSIDVRALSASQDGQFTISAVSAQGAGLFSVSPTGAMKQLLQSPAPFGSSDISVDGRRLIVSHLIANRWQLVTVDLLSHAQKQFTASDCNSDVPQWKDSQTIIYATDCERGNGQTTLAELRTEN
jgi:Glycosyltransferase family 87